MKARTREVGLVDTTLRDGVQALWSSRLAVADIVPIARALDKAGFDAIDLMGNVQFEVAVKHLRENPWERTRIIRNVVRETPLITHLRSRSITSFDVMPDDVIRLMIERLAANGFRRVMIFDALHDLDNLRFSLEVCRQYGFHVSLVVFYTISPIHTEDYYRRKVEDLVRLGPDSICVRDASGLLTPERVGKLFPIIRQAMGSVPLEFKSHCTTGLATECYVEAIKHGVDAVYTASTPLAHGPSVPPAEAMLALLGQLGVRTRIDPVRLADVAEYFTDFAQRNGKPIGKPVGNIDADQYEHQVPGGMISFLKDQLAAMRLEHKLPEVLEEFPKVRADMGYPTVVTPVSQLIGVQAVLNVVGGGRYKNVPVEVQKYVKGYYGQPEAPLAAELCERVAVLHPQALSSPPNDVIANTRRKFGPFESDDDLLLHVLFRPEQLQGLVLRKAAASQAAGLSAAGRTLVEILQEVSRRNGLSQLEIRTKTYSLSARRRAAG